MKPGDAVALEIIGLPPAAAINVPGSSREKTRPGVGGVVQPGNAGGSLATGDGLELKFRNRERELDAVVSALDNDDASHFWLYVAPPQLGKTWFLREIGKRLPKQRSRCRVHYVDAREIAADANDPLALLAHMYGVSPSRADALGIARAISATNRYNLCLLDSAELLSNDTVRAVRASLAEVARELKVARSRDARLALVAASRQDDAWSGVLPLRMSVRPLTPFALDVVLDALADLAAKMHKEYSRGELEPLARQVHQLSEGLPALLAAYLAWIRRAEWVGLDQLADRDCFDEIATPYIGEGLLSADSLLGRRPDPPPALRPALIEALCALVRYRFFTGSHLSYHARQQRTALHDALRRLGWSDERVWDALSRTDILLLPQHEMWHAVSPPIRRLLFRHWYAAAGDRVRAHRESRAFLDASARYLTGGERAKVIIECLWHEAEALSLSQNPGKPDRLLQLARGLSGELSESARAEAAKAGAILVPRFRQQEIRDFICKLLDDDMELVHAIDDDDLFASIRQIMSGQTEEACHER